MKRPRKKYTCYVVSPFEWKFCTRTDAERAFVSTGRTTTFLYGVTPNNEYIELKSKY